MPAAEVKGRNGVYADLMELSGDRDICIWGGCRGIYVLVYSGWIYRTADSL